MLLIMNYDAFSVRRFFIAKPSQKSKNSEKRKQLMQTLHFICQNFMNLTLLPDKIFMMIRNTKMIGDGDYDDGCSGDGNYFENGNKDVLSILVRYE